ncbi:MAG: TrbC/VirB2 family protein [Candidatus Nomurabacteria bacterium]
MKSLNKRKYTIISFVSRYLFVFFIIFSLFAPMIVAKAAINVSTGIANPLGSTGPQNIPDFIERLIKIVLTVGVPVLVLAFIYAGFLYVKAQGNSGELEVAHRTLLYTVIGGVLLLGAYVIAQAIGSTVTDISSGV